MPTTYKVETLRTSGNILYITYTNGICDIYKMSRISCDNLDSVVVKVVKDISNVLTSNERRKHEATMADLNNGINPYTKVKNRPYKLEPKIEVESKVLTPKQRREKFNSVVGSSTWETLEDLDPSLGGSMEFNPSDLHCPFCAIKVEAVSSIYGRCPANRMGKKVVETPIPNTNPVEFERSEFYFPIFKTGYFHSGCVSLLYSEVDHDKDGNIRRSFEYLDRPVTKTTESYRKNHRVLTHSVVDTPRGKDSKGNTGPRGREVVKSITTIQKETKDMVIEWEVPKERLAVEKARSQDEVDPAAFRALYKLNGNRNRRF